MLTRFYFQFRVFSGGITEAETGASRDASWRSLRRANSMGEHGCFASRVLRLAARWLPNIHRLCILFGPVRIQLQRGTDKHLDERGELSDSIVLVETNHHNSRMCPRGQKTFRVRLNPRWLDIVYHICCRAVVKITIPALLIQSFI